MQAPRRLLWLMVLMALAALALLTIALKLGFPVAPLPAALLPATPDTALQSLTPPLRGFVSRGLESAIGHFGVDVAIPSGTPVRAAAAGRVVLADSTHAGGQTVILVHAGGLTTVYQHNERLLVRAGQAVAAGEIVARSGNTGRLTTGPHLHFEAWRNGQPIDVRPLIEETEGIR